MSHTTVRLVSIMKLGSVFVAENIYEAALPFHNFAKAFGLACYGLKSKGSSKVSDLIILVLALAYWLVNCAFQIISIHDGTNAHRVLKDSRLLFQMNEFGFLLQTAQNAFLVLFSYCKRHRIQNMYKLFHQFDQKLKNEHWFYQTNISRFYFILIVFFVILNIFLMLLMIVLTSYPILLVILRGISHVVYILVAGQFVMAVVASTKRMRVLFANVR